MAIAEETWIVTGASRGIGAAVARGLWQEGARLVLNARSGNTLEALAAELGDPRRTRIVTGDINLAETSERIARAATSLGGPLGLVHNAGVAAPGPRLWELDEESADQVLGVNVLGALHLVRALVPPMLEDGGGCIVMVGSGVAQRNALGLGVYGMAKAAEEYAALQVALEAPDLVSFVWRPGVVDTDMQTSARSAPPDVAAPFVGYRDRGLLLTPEESATDLVSRLAGDRSSLSGSIVSAM